SDEVANGTSGIFVGWRSRKLSDVEKTRRSIGCHVGLKYRELDVEIGERYQDHDMIVRLDDTSKEVFIEFSEMSEEDSEGKKYVRRQFPIVTMYAMTMHKSQGMTLKRAVIDLRGCTQKLAYTAITRVISSDSLGVVNLSHANTKRLSEPTREDRVVKKFYQNYVGIDIPTRPLNCPL